MAMFTSTLLLSIASGFIPLINIEVYLIGISIHQSGQHWLLITTAAAIGQTIAKSVTYFLSRYANYFLNEKYTLKIKQIKAFQDRWAMTGLSVLFCSTFLGFPPLYLSSIYYGLIKFNSKIFISMVFIGRWLRFSAIFIAPNTIKWLYHFF